MSIDKILIATNKIRDSYPELNNITEVYESIIGLVVFQTADGMGFTYDLENDIITVIEGLE